MPIAQIIFKVEQILRNCANIAQIVVIAQILRKLHKLYFKLGEYCANIAQIVAIAQILRKSRKLYLDCANIGQIA